MHYTSQKRINVLETNNKMTTVTVEMLKLYAQLIMDMKKQTDSGDSVQTGSGAHPASYPMGTERGKERPRRDADHSPPSSAEVKYE
jgi:hypothetical protein